MSDSQRSIQVLVGRGSKDLESRLLAEVAQRLGDGDQHPFLESPLVLVVPSQSLRLHISRVLALRVPRSRVGVRCTTLHAIATDLVSSTSQQPIPTCDPTGLFARRLAALEGPLANALSHLSDGFRSVLPSVRDLLDAGLEVPLVEGLTDALEEDGPKAASRLKVTWAQSLVRVAAGTLLEMKAHGLGRSSTLLSDAADVLWGDTPGFAPRRILVYGFADATGVATDLIEALLKRFGGTTFLDDPPDLGLQPAEGSESPPWQAAARFGRRFRERLLALEQGASEESQPSPAQPEPSIRIFRGQGRDAEIREVGRRIGELLDSGLRPENVGVVARNLEPYRAHLRTHLDRIGIPFSGQGAKGLWTPAGHKLTALRELLSSGERTSIERWLATRTESEGEGPATELCLALYSLGCGRIGDLVRRDFGKHILAKGVPLRIPGAAEDPDAHDDLATFGRRRISGEELARAQERARALHKLLATWTGLHTMQSHRSRLLKLARDHLGWDLAVAPGSWLREIVDGTLGGFPADFELELQEVVLLLEEPIEAVGRQDLGGAGGGVQILDVIEARGRTFSHLFLIGLNRGTFPRVVHEDPLLPDSLRRSLAREGAGALPDLTDKLTGTDEERFLFCQNLSAADKITLSWLTLDDDGSEKNLSPLLERLRWSDCVKVDDDWSHPPLAPAIYSQGASRIPTTEFDPRPAFEHAILAAVHGDRASLASPLAAALDQTSGATHSAEDASSLAFSKLRLLQEIDPDFSTSAGRKVNSLLGPYHGIVGKLSEGRDSRIDKIWLTHLERNASCPWQFFLERVLAVEPLPDPLEALPGFDPALLGLLVHEVLERLVDLPPERNGLQVAELADLAPIRATWPGETRLEALLTEQALATMHGAGISVPGFEKVLVEAARPYLEVARHLDFSAGQTPQVLATEVSGSIRITDLQGQERRLRFRADRVDQLEDGLSFTDYKTGKNSISQAAREATRHKHVLKAVRSGARLQVAAYARSAGNERDRAQYLFLTANGETSNQRLRITLHAEDEQMREAFDRAVSTILAGRDRGIFFPRLLNPDDPSSTPRSCSWCSVKQACLQGDSGARSRLAGWAQRAADSSPPGDAALEAAFLELWRLPLGDAP